MTFGKVAFKSSIVACAMLGVWAFLSLPAAAGEGGVEEAWKAERRKLEQVIEERVKEEVAKNVTEKQIAAQLRMKWPVTAPPKSKELIAAAVEKGIEEEAAQRFPESKRREFEEEAEKKYRLYERGDYVEFKIRGGMGPNATVKGKLYEKTLMRLKVSSRYVLRTDIAEEVCARFWEDVCEKYKNKYIRVQNVRYDAKIEAYKDELRGVKLPQSLKAARYIRDPRSKPGTIKLDRWFAESDVLKHFYDVRKKAFESKIRPEITVQVFTSNGFEEVEDTVNFTKEWMPKREAVSFRARLKALLEKKKAAAKEAESKKAQGMGMMGPGMGGGEGEGGDVAVPGMQGMPGMPGMQGEPGVKGPGATPGGTKKPGKGAGGKNPFDEDPW